MCHLALICLLKLRECFVFCHAHCVIPGVFLPSYPWDCSPSSLASLSSFPISFSLYLLTTIFLSICDFKLHWFSSYLYTYWTANCDWIRSLYSLLSHLAVSQDPRTAQTRSHSCSLLAYLPAVVTLSPTPPHPQLPSEWQESFLKLGLLSLFWANLRVHLTGTHCTHNLCFVLLLETWLSPLNFLSAG